MNGYVNHTIVIGNQQTQNEPLETPSCSYTYNMCSQWILGSYFCENHRERNCFCLVLLVCNQKTRFEWEKTWYTSNSFLLIYTFYVPNGSEGKAMQIDLRVALIWPQCIFYRDTRYSIISSRLEECQTRNWLHLDKIII